MDEPRTINTTVAIWVALLGAAIAVKIYAQVPIWGWGTGVVWFALALMALLTQANPNGRAYLASTLKHSRYTQFYLAVARPLNDWFWSRVCTMGTTLDGTPAFPPQRATFPELVRDALTWKLVDRALMIAAFYPLVALLLPWLMGGNSVLGAGVEIFSVTNLWPDRVLVMGPIAIMMAGLFSTQLDQQQLSLPRTPKITHILAVGILIFSAIGAAFTFIDSLPLLFLVALTATIVVIGSPGTYAVLMTGTISVSYAYTYAYVDTFPFTLASSFAVGAATVALIYHRFYTKERQGLAAVLLALFWAVGLLTFMLLLDFDKLTVQWKAMLVFLGVLPLINGLFDALSYALTLALMRRGLGSRHALWLGFSDLALALVLFMALGATTVVVIGALNALGTAPLYDLAALFAGLQTTPGDYWWLYLILFSTVVPTGLHLLIAVLALQRLVPLWCRQCVAGWVEKSPHNHPVAVGAFLAQATIWWLPLIALAGVGWGLWQMGSTFATAVGLFYLNQLESLALWIGAI